MSHRFLNAAVLATALLIVSFVVAVGVSRAGSTSRAPSKLAPPVSCTSANRMDIFIDEDNIMWECSCEMLKTGNICRWQVIGGVDPVDSRKQIKRKHHARHGLVAPVLSRVPA